MQSIYPIITPRLILRAFREEDLGVFSLINQDPKVMEFFPKLLTVEESKSFMEKSNAHINQSGFGFLACELKESGNLIGFVGLSTPSFQASFTPCIEIGWRLAFAAWGKGYAPEAAKRLLEIGFSTLNLQEIVAFTVMQNFRSRRVMEKIGMQQDHAGSFNHPLMPTHHALSPHVLYRMRA